jgi:site-specific DNA recombinase
MPIGIYLRVSTEEQRERQSIATQREFAERYSSLHSLTAFRTYADDGVSGTVPLEQRPEAQQMLRDARNRKFDQLLVYRLDRLGRDTLLILNAVKELERLGVRVRSMTEEFDTASATGRLMLTLLSGFASHEREVIRERSVAGMNRVAEAGAWMGGITPYAYRKVGEKRDARLVISTELIPGLAMSESDVVREVFRMAAVEQKSCRRIAELLNALRVPCAYSRDERLVLRGKRKERTAGVWRPGRVRGLLTNKTYYGIHEFGKRAARKREVIRREVPAIVAEETWQKAQETLKANFLFNARSAQHQYLLRGMVKCGLCGRNYTGVAATRPGGRFEHYYKCNASHSPQIYRVSGKCESRSVRGDQLEQQVWADIYAFLRDPKPVLAQLQMRLESESRGSAQIQNQLKRLEQLLAEKAHERDRVLVLYRRGRLNDAELDRQLDEVGREQTVLDAQIAELRAKVAGVDAIGSSINSAQALLEKLRKRLDQPVSFDIMRRLIEILVAGIRVETTEVGGVKVATTTVTYRFGEPDQPLPLVLPQNYSTGKVVRIPMEPKTIGDHIRKRRLSLKLLQRDVAERIGVDESTIHNWELNHSQADFRFMPAIIEFLGYNPLPEGTTWAERLVRHRTTLGLSQKAAAGRIGVDPATLARWERGECEPMGRYLAMAERFLRGLDEPKKPLRRTG